LKNEEEEEQSILKTQYW